MAIGLISDVDAFDANFQTGMMEGIASNVNVFSQSNGSIRLLDERLGGDYSRRSIRRRLANSITRRDPASTAAVTDKAITATSDVGVKLKNRFGPFANTRDSFNEMLADAGGSIDALAMDLGRVAAEEMLDEQIDTALLALVAAHTGQAAITNDITAATTKTVTTAALIDTLATLGAAANQVVAWVMHSSAYYALVKEQISANIDGVSNFNVATASPVTMNRPVIITDSASLIVADAGGAGVDGYATLGLRADACRIINSRDMDMLVETRGGGENLITRIQAEYDYNVELSGFAWDVANGGANPSTATLGTATNWDKVGTDAKYHLGGAALVSL